MTSEAIVAIGTTFVLASSPWIVMKWKKFKFPPLSVAMPLLIIPMVSIAVMLFSATDGQEVKITNWETLLKFVLIPIAIFGLLGLFSALAGFRDADPLNHFKEPRDEI